MVVILLTAVIEDDYKGSFDSNSSSSRTEYDTKRDISPFHLFFCFFVWSLLSIGFPFVFAYFFLLLVFLS